VAGEPLQDHVEILGKGWESSLGDQALGGEPVPEADPWIRGGGKVDR
jgi:hypothetical protein